MVRAARDLPILGAMVRGADRVWWARTIRRADIVDAGYVTAQGGPASPRAAVRAYVRSGFRRGLSLNPLFSEQLVSSQLSDAGRVPALYAYLVNDPRVIETSVSWDAPAYVRQHPEALTARGGPLGSAWRRARHEGTIELGRGERRSPVTWSAVVDATQAAVDRARGVAGPLPTNALRAKTIVLVRLGARERDLAGTLLTAAELAGERTALVLAIAPRAVAAWTEAALLSTWVPGLFTCTDAPDLIEQVDRSAPDGTSLLVRGPDAEISADDLQKLGRAAAAGTAAPLWLDSHDGTVAAAGVIVHAGSAHRLLAGHPAEDARALATPVLSPGLASETFARIVGTPLLPVATVLESTVRAPRSPGRAFASRVDTTADTDVDGLLAPVGLHTTGWKSDGPLLARAAHAPVIVGDRSMPRLRWAIKIVAPPGKPGEAWGDTHFARGIADALRRLGQVVVIDAYDARARPSAYLDDVVLALRGPEPFRPQPGAASLLWIISHPDQITADEIGGFDRVYAGSTAWARSATIRLGQPILPLLQCTDATRFRPVGGPRTDEVVFVGTARGIPRPSIIEPLRAGIPVSVYGPDWRGWIPASAIKGVGIPNAELPSVYEHASLVLNDHWPAMRDSGFVSNRLYDVVAAGGRAISDHVDGIEEIFAGAVATYRTIPELLDLLRTDPSTVFPDEERLTTISALIRERDSFDARAHTLLEAALAARAM